MDPSDPPDRDAKSIKTGTKQQAYKKIKSTTSLQRPIYLDAGQPAWRNPLQCKLFGRGIQFRWWQNNYNRNYIWTRTSLGLKSLLDLGLLALKRAAKVTFLFSYKRLQFKKIKKGQYWGQYWDCPCYFILIAFFSGGKGFRYFFNIYLAECHTCYSRISHGTRQGSVFSPALSCIYLDDLIKAIRKIGLG